MILTSLQTDISEQDMILCPNWKGFSICGKISLHTLKRRLLPVHPRITPLEGSLLFILGTCFFIFFESMDFLPTTTDFEVVFWTWGRPTCRSPVSTSVDKSTLSLDLYRSKLRHIFQTGLETHWRLHRHVVRLAFVGSISIFSTRLLIRRRGDHLNVKLRLVQLTEVFV